MLLRRTGEWSYSSKFLELSTIWGWVVSSPPQLLYPGEGAPLVIE